MSSFTGGTNKFDGGESSNLRKEYHQIIDRLVEWEATLGQFQEQLRLKDEKIALLEERVTQLSLEIQAEKKKASRPL